VILVILILVTSPCSVHSILNRILSDRRQTVTILKAPTVLFQETLVNEGSTPSASPLKIRLYIN